MYWYTYIHIYIYIYKREEEIHIYVDANNVVAPLTMRMPMYFTCKVKNNRREVKYFNNIDDDTVSIKL